eukprot:Em0012g294a
MIRRSVVSDDEAPSLKQDLQLWKSHEPSEKQEYSEERGGGALKRVLEEVALISTTFPGPPITAGWSMKYWMQMSLIKLYQSTAVALATLKRKKP